MNKLTLCSVLACAMACAGVAFSAEKRGVYIAGSGAWNTVSDDLQLTDLSDDNGPIADQTLSLDDGYTIAAAVGYDFGGFRLEGEIAYRDNDVEELRSGPFVIPNAGNADFSATSFMVNAMADAPLGDKFFLYGGIGGGIVVADVDDPFIAKDEIFLGALAYQVMLGVGVNLSDHVALTVGYRLFSAFDASFEDVESYDSDGDGNDEDLEGDMKFPVFHEVSIGLRYTF